nr:hypothetical protein [uncultured Dongia sp.]
MTHEADAERRDAVLAEFHRECTLPSAEQIINWTARYPEFAEDIRAHAAIIRDWAAAEGGSDEAEVEQTMMERARSRALNAIFKAQKEAHSESRPQIKKTFDDLLASASATTQSLSREIDIPREVLADLFRGRMRPPVGSRLITALLQKLQATALEFDGALTHALANPSLGHAHATKHPSVVSRSYEEIIRSTTMPADRKAYWLERD